MTKSEFNPGSSLAEDINMTYEHQSNSGLQIKAADINAPIEIKSKPQEQTQLITVDEREKNEMQDLVEKRKKKLQECAVKIFKQIKNGCSKDICFSTYCKKNPYCKHELEQFKEDKQILAHLFKVLLKTKDPEDLICSDTVTINRENYDKMTNVQLMEAFEDVFLFSCSFVDKQE